MKLSVLTLLVVVISASLHLAEANSIGPKAEKKVLVCYLNSFSRNNAGAGLFQIENIDANLCTHLIYGFADLCADNTICPLDPAYELPQNGGGNAYNRFTGLKKQNPELKTLISIGGWNEDSAGFSKMASDPAARATFIASVVELIKRHDFDGLDFDWEYPTQRGGVPADKANFAQLLTELDDAFDADGFLLTAAVSGSKSIIDAAYDVPALAEALDYFIVMSYDYHGTWEPYTGHNAPRRASPNWDSGDNVELNQEFSVNYFIEKGAPASKIILGIPTYGRGWTLNDPTVNGFYAPADQPMAPGPFVGVAGFLGFNEICELSLSADWEVNRDPDYDAPYAVNGLLWLGYDDEKSVVAKAEYVVLKDLAGANVWSLDTDDFLGTCTGTKFGLITAIGQVLEVGGAKAELMPKTRSISRFHKRN